MHNIPLGLQLKSAMQIKRFRMLTHQAHVLHVHRYMSLSRLFISDVAQRKPCRITNLSERLGALAKYGLTEWHVAPVLHRGRPQSEDVRSIRWLFLLILQQQNQARSVT